MYDIEMPLVPILAHMQHLGMKLDTKRLDDFGYMLTMEAERLEGEIYDCAGETFNIGSPRQLGTVLFEKLEMCIRDRGLTTPRQLKGSCHLPAVPAYFILRAGSGATGCTSHATGRFSGCFMATHGQTAFTVFTVLSWRINKKRQVRPAAF